MVDISLETESISDLSKNELDNNDNFTMHWHQSLWNALMIENYSLVVSFYEDRVQSKLHDHSDYLYLGLAYLLDGAEDLAHITWFTTISENELIENHIIKELSKILAKEAVFQFKKENFEISWIIRQHLREIDPKNIKNHLDLIILAIILNKFSVNLLKEYQTIEILRSNLKATDLDEYHVELFIKNLLKYYFIESIEIISIMSISIKNKKMFVNIILPIVHEIRPKNPEFAGEICKVCSEVLPGNMLILQTICWCYGASSNFKEAINSAIIYYQSSNTTVWKILSVYLVIREKNRGGDWLDIDEIISEYKALMYELDKNGLPDDEFVLAKTMATIPCLLQYYQDDLAENRYLQNRISRIFQEKMDKKLLPRVNELSYIEIDHALFKDRKSQKKSKLKIGFLVSKLKTHSVGWLSRWLFHYYDRDKFDFSIFLINQSSGDYFTETWFESKVKQCTYFSEGEFQKAAESIYLNEVDILIDMDSTTSYDACLILATKPAPVQATWLGFEASGIPTVDYFIVDRYLLPDHAQEYYSEKLWRLPQTYLAVDGFEVEVPKLSRWELEIPNNAVVYLSAQTGQKRNPNTIRLQLRIIKAVSNSYLLIKGSGDNSTIQKLFTELAQEEGVDLDQLRFLSLDENEFVHRANLQIADIILDTYPYNGATTTLEALWIGVPIVTRLGQQCAARNSYTFMAQVGVTDGIAITDEEYIDWGIRFGKEPQLRQKVSMQLKESRHTSPLWNAKEFTREMESAFQEMWEIYTQLI